MITKIEAEFLHEKLAQNRRRGLAALKPLPVEVLMQQFDKAEIGREVKTLHEPFEQWLRLHLIPFVHSRADRKSTTAIGTPDFVVLSGGFGVAIEFKALPDPAKGLSGAQIEWMGYAMRRNYHSSG